MSNTCDPSTGREPATDAAAREPVTRREHHHSWSANLEGPEHADDAERIVREAIDAIEATATGYHVNLVTHGDRGDPRSYLWPELGVYADERDGQSLELDWEYVDRCGCGGHVTRVHVVGETSAASGSCRRK